jgi:hypothetical protein
LIITGTNSKINAVPFFGRHLGFSVDSTVYKIADTIIKKFDTWAAAGISFPSALQLEILRG